MDAGSLTLLLTAATAAGWVDAVVGGGGLLLLPALLIGLPQVPLATALGTNKMTAIAGTTSAAITYARRTRIDWRVAGPAGAIAVVVSGIGALAGHRADPEQGRLPPGRARHPGRRRTVRHVPAEQRHLSPTPNGAPRAAPHSPSRSRAASSRCTTA